ncbi:MAG: allophanate hydrolase [Alphaproteobacteria bacterium]
MLYDNPLTLSLLDEAYGNGLSPSDVVRAVYRRIQTVDDKAIFIHLRPMEDVIADAESLPGNRADLPLWGVPYVVKDNIDVADIPTTAACPEYAYTAAADSFVVSRLRAAGALLVGKTNMDQFATGLVGVRSPYGTPRNAVDPEIVPGGSSSGSGVAVGHGFVTFSLGTDTAGSGRVPAALNNIVGLKPTLGSLSASGVVPACRTLDTISVFATNVADAFRVFQLTCAEDPNDPYSRNVAPGRLHPPRAGLRIGVPDAASLKFFGDDCQAANFEQSLARLTDLGAQIVKQDFTPLHNVADMLYDGAWVAERYAVIEKLMRDNPTAVHPITAKVIGAGATLSAADAFRSIYKLKELTREAQAILCDVDMLCVPTIPTFYTLADLKADPITPNSNLGTYTNFVNLLDMCGIAVPAQARSDGRPGSITLLAPSGNDAQLASLAHAYEGGSLPGTSTSEPVDADEFALAVCGAHMSGMPLNHELTSRGGRLVEATATAPCYRLYALAGGPPERPGLLREEDGAAIQLEVWALPRKAVGDFVAGVPSPLSIGTVELAGGQTVHGFLVEADGIRGAKDITHLRSWRAYTS